MNLKEISVVIVAFNEAANIERCLESVRGFGEAILVDSFSDDGTVEAARGYPVTLYARPYRSAAAQKNWAIDRARNAWVLVLDADEALTEELRREIEALDGDRGPEGYWVRRRSEYLGRRIRFCGWQRDKVLRLFRRDRGRYDDRDVHEEVVLGTDAPALEGRIAHYPYRGLEQHLRKIQDYSARGAADYLRKGGRAPLAQMLAHPPARFFRMYVAQQGWRDGALGFVLCLVSSYGVFLKYAKAWEALHCRPPR